MVWAPEGFFDRHLPLLLLTGFLGSGKTTLLNRLLSDPRLANSAVIVNEFGAIPVDHTLIDAPAGAVAALPNGCMCCLASDDLYVALEGMFAAAAARGAPPFQRVIIETSGLADPAGVLQSVTDNPLLNRFLWLDRIVTTVDGIHGPGQITTHPEALQQVRLADWLVLSKTDLAPEGAQDLGNMLSALSPRAEIGRSDDPGLVAALLSPGFLAPEAAASPLGDWATRELGVCGCGDPAHDHGHHHTNTAQTVTLMAEGALDWRRFQLWLAGEQQRLGTALLRVKGLLRVAGEAGPVVIHAVQTTLHVPVALAQWPADIGETRLVFILAAGTDTAALTQRWQAFLAE